MLPTFPLRAAIRDVRQGLVAIAAFSFAINLLMLASPLYMMQVFDRVLSGGSVPTLLLLTALAGAAMLALAALDTVRAGIVARIGGMLDLRFGTALMRKAVSRSVDGEPVGARPLQDLAKVTGFVGGQSVLPLFDVPWTPLFIAIIWILHPWLGILALGSALLLAALAVLNEAATRRLIDDAVALQRRSYQTVEAAARNADVVHAMGLMPGLLRRWTESSADLMRRQLDAGDRNAAVLGVTKFVRTFVQIAAMALGAWLVLRGELTSGGMLASSTLLGRALAPVEQALGVWKPFVAARAAWRALRQFGAFEAASPPPMPLPRPRGELTVTQASVRIGDSQKPVLNGITFALKPGESLAVLGPSAAGKSTLCRLLVGSLAPRAGSVRLDGAELSQWDPDVLGRHIGYVPQDVELFAGTVRDNIARMGDAEPDAVIAAARLADVHEMILRLPAGYETEIGGGGRVLSGGQRQRIGLARALFGDPSLVVLDEPNANLDIEGDAALLRAMAAMKRRGTTVVLVTHRPSLVTEIDKLLVLKDGAVAAFGPRETVQAMLRGPAPAPAGPAPVAVQARSVA